MQSDRRRQGSGESRRSEAAADLIASGQHVMTVCNSCRYCEAYCPVFPAMETRTTFTRADLGYLANLCHNCGECLYACQYAPPHEFGINVPRVLAEIRLASYEDFCWPAFLSGTFKRAGVVTSILVAVVTTLALWPFAQSVDARGDFYAVIPHDVMVGIFGIAAGFVAVALVIGGRRAWRSYGPSRSHGVGQALGDILSLRHLHSSGMDCTHDVEQRAPWRRWFHHCTFYGFLLCFASTSVAALYHVVFGWPAPYAYTSAPVVLGAAGGIGLVIGPLGLLALRQHRDPLMTDPSQRGLDASFIVMLFMTSVTGLLLLSLRDTAFMTTLLVIHLGFVLALFLTLPYGKFVHGVYRTVALLKFSSEVHR